MSVLRAVAPILDNMTDDERHATMLVLGGGGLLAALGIAGTLVDPHARRQALNRNKRVAVDLTNVRCVGRWVCLEYMDTHDHLLRPKFIHDSKLHFLIFSSAWGGLSGEQAFLALATEQQGKQVPFTLHFPGCRAQAISISPLRVQYWVQYYTQVVTAESLYAAWAKDESSDGQGLGLFKPEWTNQRHEVY